MATKTDNIIDRFALQKVPQFCKNYKTIIIIKRNIKIFITTELTLIIYSCTIITEVFNYYRVEQL